MKKATACAPATVGNVGVGFDLLGFAFDGPEDQVTVRVREEGGVLISDSGHASIPKEAERNTAGKALLALINGENLGHGFEVRIKKGIPLCSGLGGSAASAVGAVVAASAILTKKISQERLLAYAMAGEAVSSGSAHGDNVAPCLLGGLTFGAKEGEVTRWTQLPIPPGIVAAVVHPELEISTREAREVLGPHVELSTHTSQMQLFGTFIAACYGKDLARLEGSLRDLVVEPQRKKLIQGFDRVSEAAWSSPGCLGFSISGAGPAVFGWYRGKPAATTALNSMIANFKGAGVQSKGWTSGIRKKGATLRGAKMGAKGGHKGKKS